MKGTVTKMTQEETLKLAVKTLDKKKAEDIRVLGIRDLTIIADYFIIASGLNGTHTKTLADELEAELKKNGAVPARIQSDKGSSWIILDYSDIVVHIFYKETRDFYSLERLWQDGLDVDISGWKE